MMNKIYGFTGGGYFFLTCEEFFKINNGKEWFVSHYLLGKKFKLEEGKCCADLKPQGFFNY